MTVRLPLALLCALVCISPGSAGAAGAACPAGRDASGACVRLEDEGASVLQVRRERTSEEESVALVGENAARQSSASTSGFIVTATQVLAIVTAALEAEAIARMQEAAYDWLTGSQTFAHAVGPFGMPLAIGVINDLLEPVTYASFSLVYGHAFGVPKLGEVIKPGEMMQWFLFTQGVKVELTMTFTSGDKSWSVAAAQYRVANLFKHCDRLRMRVVPGLNTSAALDGLCYENGGPGAAGIQGNGSYKLTMLLNESLQHAPHHDEEDEDHQSLSALQVVEGASANSRALTRVGFFITPAMILSYAVKTVTAAILARMVSAAFQYLSGHDSFQRALGLTGLPLSVGVINDTPFPVIYKQFHLRDGSAWGYPGLKTHIAPGEMFQWFLYTHTTSVEATMLFESSYTFHPQSWSMAVAQYRFGGYFDNCDKLRVKVVDGANLSATLQGLCKSNGGGDGAGIRVQGGYKVTILLNEVLKGEPMGATGIPEAAEAKAVVKEPSAADIKGSVIPRDDEVTEATPEGESLLPVIDHDTLIIALKFVAGTIAQAGIREALNYLKGSDTFQHAVTPIGLPLTLGIINDTPEPVQFVGFQLREGAVWGHPALMQTMAPGEMMSWYFYTHAISVEAALQFRSGNRTWSVGVAQERLGDWFTSCDRMRCHVVPSANMEEALAGMCRTSDGAGIRVQGGYRMAVLLNEATEALDAASTAVDSPTEVVSHEAAEAAETEGRKFLPVIDHNTAILVLKFIAGAIASDSIQEALNYLKGSDTFQHAVTPVGLPLTLGIINDTPEPVQFVGFQLRAGAVWGHPALMTTMAPGEMMSWYFFTHAMSVEAALQFRSGNRTWSIGVAQERLGDWFTECDQLRCHVVPSDDMEAALAGMCKTVDTGGIRVQGSYRMAVMLNEATESLDAPQPQAARPQAARPQLLTPVVDDRSEGLGKKPHITDTASIIIGAATTVTVNAMAAAFKYFTARTEFEAAVGFTGLPVTVGVINDTPEPVKYVDFRLGAGNIFAFPALKGELGPGKMMKWFLYTSGSALEASMLFQSGEKSWSIAVAQYRVANVFTHCNRLRCNPIMGGNMSAAVEGLCVTQGGANPEAVQVQNSYKLIVLLSKVQAAEQAAMQGMGVLSGASS